VQFTDDAITKTVYVLIAICGVAILALVLSKQSNTSGVFGAFGSTISQMICTALSPVTGGKCGDRSLTPDVHSTITF